MGLLNQILRNLIFLLVTGKLSFAISMLNVFGVINEECHTTVMEELDVPSFPILKPIHLVAQNSGHIPQDLQFSRFNIYRICVLTHESSQLSQQQQQNIGLRGDIDFILLFVRSETFTVKPEILKSFYNVIALHIVNTSHVELHRQCLFCKTDFEPTSHISFPIPKNLNGKELVLSCFTFSLWFAHVRFERNQLQLYGGTSKYALDHLAASNNFTIKIIPSTGGGIGYKNSNGTWNGIVGDVMEGKTDVGMILAHYYDTSLAVSFSQSINQGWLTFYTALPSRLYTWKSIYWPLQGHVWFGLASTILFLTIFCSLGQIFGQYSFASVKLSPSKAFIYFNATLLEQDKKDLEKGPTLRVIATVWLMFQIVITTAYRSKLTTLMTFPVFTTPPATFSQLAESDYEISLTYLGGMAFQYLKTSTNPVIQNIYGRMVKERNFLKCLEKSVSNSNHACITYNLQKEYLANRNLTDIHGNVPLAVATEGVNSMGDGFVFRKGSILKSTFDAKLRPAVAIGILKKWKDLDQADVLRDRWEWKRNNGLDNSDKVSSHLKEPLALKMDHIIGSFYICGTAMILACFFFVFETVFISRMLYFRTYVKTIRIEFVNGSRE